MSYECPAHPSAYFVKILELVWNRKIEVDRPSMYEVMCDFQCVSALQNQAIQQKIIRKQCDDRMTTYLGEVSQWISRSFSTQGRSDLTKKIASPLLSCPHQCAPD